MWHAGSTLPIRATPGEQRGEGTPFSAQSMRRTAPACVSWRRSTRRVTASCLHVHARMASFARASLRLSRTSSLACSLTRSLSLSLSFSLHPWPARLLRSVYSDVGDGTWGGTNPAMPWDWKGGKLDSGVYDNVLPDADAHK